MNDLRKNTSNPLSNILSTTGSYTTIKTALCSALLIAMASPLIGCGSDNDHDFVIVDSQTEVDPLPQPAFEPISLTIAHINDHHSHLEPEGRQSFVLDGTTYRSERGGFARVKSVFDDMESLYSNDNLLKLHAGDAITGTSYFSFFKGDADADMINTVCFDAFALGNHEFDESDAGLKLFIDRLHGTQNNPNNCQTPVLGANVKPAIGTPLAPSNVDDYIKPYTITTTAEGVKIGIIGIDIEGKTKNSSRPLASTDFLDETTTAQTYIDELKAQGIEHIVLLTHYTYDNDIDLAAALTGVDVIIGGDSHTLLGDFTRYGQSAEDTFGSQGAYPTVLSNKDGETVCVGQAWEYTKAVGVMRINFNDNGSVNSCTGSAIIPVSETFERYDATSGDFIPLAADANQTILDSLLVQKDFLLQKDLILPYAPDTEAATLLNSYTVQIGDKLKQVIATASETLCLVRVPGTTRSSDIAGCEDTANQSRGSDAAQIVAKAFLDGALEADFALQNAGGVRATIMQGEVSYDTAYTVLPFGNTLVNLEMTAPEVKATLEDAIANHMDFNGSSGSHPYADGLRWDLDLTQPQGSRVSNLEVRDRATGVWTAFDLTDTTRLYTVVTNDYIAEGRDGYTTLGNVFADKSRVVDTKLLYTQSFIDYAEKIGTLQRPARSDYSHKNVITADGTVLQY